ncbi:MAG: hypothetical protein GWP04_12125 [Gammaproteobacteria bacterium]|nr:hypothetical protein [Gammaproteobacteria bacterium]
MSSARSLVSVVAVVMIGIAIVAAGCGANLSGEGTTAVTVDMTDEALRPVYLTWINMLGLNQADPAIWRIRLSEACTLGVWNKTVAVDLATRYIAEDASVSARIPELGPAPVEDAADALWLMALQVCRDRFPAGTTMDDLPFPSKSPNR